MDRDELAHVRLFFCQIGQHDVPAVADKTCRAGLFAALAGFVPPFGTPGGNDFRGRRHGDESARFALRSDDDF
ncbi:MAG: hypothetical protein ACO3JG_08375 [Luteolibacter sp.]